MGTAFTGLGIVHKYDELLATNKTVLFLKSPPTHALSNTLRLLSTEFVQQGYDVERFMNPVQIDAVDGLHIPAKQLFIVQASHPISIEPTELGGRHKVLSFYDVYDEEKLRLHNIEIAKNSKEGAVYVEKASTALQAAKKIHDDWEAVNGERMNWQSHEQLIESLQERFFETMQLHKTATIQHRMIGSLCATGAKDYIPSITKRYNRRFLLKGLPGTGKSTLMRALGKEAESRGVNVLYGWCGLDPVSVDVLLFPELSISIVDATPPHVYDRESERDEIIDIAAFCEESVEADKQIEHISHIYREKILDATGYMQSYALTQNRVKVLMDECIIPSIYEKKIRKLRQFIE